MKKTVAFLFAAVLVFLPVGAVAASFGSGVACLASEVSLIKTGLVGKPLAFDESDFKKVFGTPTFSYVTVVTLPKSTEGTLTLSNRRVKEGEVIRRASLSSLVFTPASLGVTEAHFTFSSPDFAGGECVSCLLRFSEKVNLAPTATGSTDLVAWVGIPTFGKPAATDPEGDEMEFELVGFPSSGTVTAFNRKSGEFSYTATKKTASGKDSIVFVVRDSYGNYSSPVTVTFRVREPLSAVRYADMEGSPAEGAAVMLTGLGAVSARVVGDNFYFDPEKSVSRAKFVAMLLKANGIGAAPGAADCCFDDADKIPAGLEGYVAKAEGLGILVGNFAAGGLYFRPNDTVTVAEAVVMVASLLGTEETEITDTLPATVPAYAKAAVATLLDAGILDLDLFPDMTAGIDRKGAAMLISAALEN